MNDAANLDIAIDGRRIRIQGEVDAATAGQVQSALEGIGFHEHVELDLDGVEFMDSSGLRTIITALSMTNANGADLRVVAASRTVRRLFEVSGVDEILLGPAEGRSSD